MWKPQADFVEQSSGDIWHECAAAVRQAVTEADINPTNVRGIGFDATCSLLALDENDRISEIRGILQNKLVLCPRNSPGIPARNAQFGLDRGGHLNQGVA